DNTFSAAQPILDSDAYSMIEQADGKVVVAGRFVGVNGSNYYHDTVVRFNADGTVDTGFNSFFSLYGYSTYTTGALKLDLTPDNKVLLGYGFNSQCCPNSYNDNGSIYRFNDNGTKDVSFRDILMAQGSLYNYTVYNEKIHLNGNFYSCNGATRYGFSVCNIDGTTDRSLYSAGGTNHYCMITDIKVLPDKKILMSAYQYSNSGIGDRASNVVRLMPDGSNDPLFNFENYSVGSVVPQSNGKIVIVDYKFLSGLQGTLKRLNYDGTEDATFNNRLYSGNVIGTIEDKLLIVKSDSYNTPHTFVIYRLLSNGLPDTGFQVDSLDNSYSAISLPDGKVLVYGSADLKLNGQLVGKMFRLNIDGTLDATFSSGTGANGAISKCIALPNGKILIGGSFTSYNNTAIKGLARLMPDGSLDLTYSCPDVNTIKSIVIQNENSYLLLGTFAGGGTLNRTDSLGIADPAYNYIFTLESSSFTNIAAYDSDRFFLYGDFKDLDSRNVRLADVYRMYYGNTKNYNTISGKVYTDENDNCVKEYGEIGLPSYIIKAEPGDIYTSSNSKGEYKVVVDTTVSDVTLTRMYNRLQGLVSISQCVSSHLVHLEGGPKDTSSFDFADSIRYCSLLSVSVGNSRRVWCNRSVNTVSYSNEGNIVESDVIIKVVYPDAIIPLSSNPAWGSKNGNVLTYNIAQVAAQSKVTIIIWDSVSCLASFRQQTVCLKAYINKKGNCINTDPSNWDKSHIAIEGKCTGAQTVFAIRNEGQGNMQDSSEFRIYQNDTLVHIANFKLRATDSLRISYVSKGNTIRLEADQRPYHPGSSHPRASIEACGTGALVHNPINTAALDDEDLDYTSSCQTILSSYDPNEKQAEPIGWSDAHYIKSTDKINYTVHFQNTGTSEANVVKIVDTLDANLDLTTFMPGASSHPYTWAISGKGQAIVTYVFDNINLPDSSVSFAESNGFIRYSIYPVTDISEGQILRNTAYIYFDYNEPVKTDIVFHEINNTMPVDLSRNAGVEIVTGTQVSMEAVGLSIAPNPFGDQIMVHSADKELRKVVVYNVHGMPVKTLDVAGTQTAIATDFLTSGMYLIKVTFLDGTMYSAKMIK
ncbi:MAG: hypothetical protein JWM14_3271, partial [Chitinophagaceae bacterium]|nr:hypothetical protein [Chitinophagaceae bacterium]